MHLALLAKWMIRYSDPTVRRVSKTILIEKYGAKTSSTSSSPF
jgi:hypothetical protein